MDFRFCPNCKNSLSESRGLFHCRSCGFNIYKNSVPTASVLPVSDGKILLCIRKKDPGRGKLDLIGGFLDNGELPEKGAVRETKEESNLEVKLVHLVGVYIGDYQYQRRIYKTLNFYYIAKIIRGQLKPLDDVKGFVWTPIAKIPTEDLAFTHQRKVFADFKKWLKVNQS